MRVAAEPGFGTAVANPATALGLAIAIGAWVEALAADGAKRHSTEISPVSLVTATPAQRVPVRPPAPC